MSLDRSDLEHLADEIEYEGGATEPRSGPPPLCPTCGYNLTGAVSSICPECGNVVTRQELKRHANDVKQALADLDGLKFSVRLGAGLSLAGTAALLLGLLLGFGEGGWVWLGRAVAVPCGLCGAMLGLGAVRVWKLPVWARGQLENPPSYPEAYAAVLLGLTIAALSVFAPF